MKFLAVFLLSAEALACSSNAPLGFTKSAKSDTFVNAEKTVSISVKCDSKLSPKEIIEAMGSLGQLKTAKSVHFVDLVPGTVRTFIGRDSVQFTAVAKTPEALEKATPAIIETLK